MALSVILTVECVVLLFPVIDCAEDKVLSVCVSNFVKFIKVLVTMWGVLLLFMQREVIACAVYCCEN
jgi:hypothetical protein